jgi:hypothetical protein
MPGRGQLTSNIKAHAKVKYGMVLTTPALRLMPYVLNRLMDGYDLDPSKLNQIDRDVLTEWRSRGWLSGGASKGSLEVSREFWDMMNDIMWSAYIDNENQEF